MRNFDAGIRELAARGHAVAIRAQRQENLGGERLVRQLEAEYPGITYGPAPWFKSGHWFALGRSLRLYLDYLRYLDSRFDGSPKLRKRAADFAPQWLSRWSGLPGFLLRPARTVLTEVFRLAEQSVPLNPTIDAFIRDHAPDVVLVTPLLYFGSPQVDFVRSARRRGIPTGLCTASWDHLTTKGLIHVIPDRVLVWNEVQKREAIELHHVPEERVAVTGAHTYDHWFHWRPRPWEFFCSVAGLDPGRPYFLYLASSKFIAPDEPRFVLRWLTQMRSNEALRNVGVLIRPHPQNADVWEAIDFTQFEHVRLWPDGGANPVDPGTKSDYFDSIYHSTAVVGVNTSGLIEAGIIGKPVYTVLTDEFADTQEGTLHFRHLVRVNGGLLNLAKSLDEHMHHLRLALINGEDNREKSRRFVEAFVRPHGIDRDAAPSFANRVEELASLSLGPGRAVANWQWLLRPILYPFARLAEQALVRDQQRRRRLKESATGRRVRIDKGDVPTGPQRIKV